MEDELPLSPEERRRAEALFQAVTLNKNNGYRADYVVEEAKKFEKYLKDGS